jgi:hypothetical protein
MKESEAQRQILDYLALGHICHYWNNSGMMVNEYKGRKSFTRFGAVGSPDIIAVVDGQYVGIEIKGHGGNQSEYQKAFQVRLEDERGDGGFRGVSAALQNRCSPSLSLG